MAAALTWAVVAGPVGPDRSTMTGLLGPWPPHGTATFTLKELKSQSTSLACATANDSSWGRDRPPGAFVQLMVSWRGAARAQTVQTMLNPIATGGRMIARPAGMRARYSATR